MRRCSSSPDWGRTLFFATIFVFGLLIAISVWNCVLYYTPNNDNSSSAEATTLIEEPIPPDDDLQNQHVERGIDVGPRYFTVPPPLSDLVLNTTTRPKANFTRRWNWNSSSTTHSKTVFSSPIALQPQPVSSEIAALPEKLDSLLDGIIPLATPTIIREATSQAEALVASVDAIATNTTAVANQVENGQLQASNTLETAEGLLASLDAAANSIAKDITPTSGFPAPILDELSEAVTSDIDDIVKVVNGPVSLVGDLIEDNVCQTTVIVNGVTSTIAGLCSNMTPPTPNTQATLTTETPVSAILPIPGSSISGSIILTTPRLVTSTSSDSTLATSPGSTSLTAVSKSQITSRSGNGANSQMPQMPFTGQVTSAVETPMMTSTSVSPQSGLQISASLTTSMQPRIGVSSEMTITGADAVVTVKETIILTEDCAIPPVRSMFLADRASTFTVYTDGVCPVPLPCPQCVSPTCHCPEAGGVTSTIPPSGSNGARGPCPGSGYTCDDCLDGWFCPPPQTPAQPGPCGFGWPCAHCDGGWFCVPQPTPGPYTCSESSEPTFNGAGTITSTITVPAQSIGPTSNQPHPRIPDKASGWDYCGCWVDQPEQRALNSEPHLNLGPLTNADCVQHCIGHGYLMAGTENGNDCYCGNFLNGTQKLDDSACSTPCSGDPRQACGGSNALCCYSPDGEAHGWASVGPQPLSATAEPPHIFSMGAGGVAHSVVTVPAIVFPPPETDLSQLVSQFGQVTQQPYGQLPYGQGSGPGSDAGGGNGGAGPVTPGGGANSPASSFFGGGTEMTTNGPGGQPEGATSAFVSDGRGSKGNGGVSPSGQVTVVPSPNSPFGISSGPGQTSPSYDQCTVTPNPTGNSGQSPSGGGQGTAASNPTDNSYGNGGNPNQTPAGQGQGTWNPSGNGVGSGQTSLGQGGTTCTSLGNEGGSIPGQTQPAASSLNSGSSGGSSCAPGSTDPSCASSGNGGSPIPYGSQGQGQGGQGQGSQSDLGGTDGNNCPSTLSPPANGGSGSSSGGNDGPHAQGQGTESGGNDGNGSPSTPGPSPTSNNGGAGNTTPTTSDLTPVSGAGVTNGGNTGTEESQPPMSNPNGEGVGSNAASINPQASGYTFPPDIQPYGARLSMTTVVTVVAWDPSDGGLKSQGELSSTPELEFEKSPTTTISTSILADPRWQRIPPVAIW